MELPLSPSAVEKIIRENRHDVLTGLPNRLAFEERLGSEVARVRRHGGELALCVLDLVALEEINASFGREVGDEVLRSVARHVTGVRGEDIAFRVGGDEFAIIFVGTDADGARIAARRVEASICRDHACGGIAIRWAVADLEGGDPMALVERAAAALDRAKRHSE